MKLLVTGGAGFIGSNFVRTRVEAGDQVVVLDQLTYAGHLENLDGVLDRIDFVRGDICDPDAVGSLVTSDLDAVVNFAAESHVDRSILDASQFVRTNVVGVQVLLDAIEAAGCRLLVQISTDEVYGPAEAGTAFTEQAALEPTSPYAASKAAADLLCLGYHRTRSTPVIITRCTNNYGPYQYPEKLIPLFLMRAMADEPLPLYGDGSQERDWLHVDDHCRALAQVIQQGKPGAIYNIAGGHALPNRELVRVLLDELGKPWSLVRRVEDRPAHDGRYSLDTTRIRDELGWTPKIALEQGIADTVRWYRDQADWLENVTGPEFDRFCEVLYRSQLED